MLLLLVLLLLLLLLLVLLLLLFMLPGAMLHCWDAPDVGLYGSMHRLHGQLGACNCCIPKVFACIERITKLTPAAASLRVHRRHVALLQHFVDASTGSAHGLDAEDASDIVSMHVRHRTLCGCIQGCRQEAEGPFPLPRGGTVHLSMHLRAQAPL